MGSVVCTYIHTVCAWSRGGTGLVACRCLTCAAHQALQQCCRAADCLLGAVGEERSCWRGCAWAVVRVVCVAWVRRQRAPVPLQLQPLKGGRGEGGLHQASSCVCCVVLRCLCAVQPLSWGLAGGACACLFCCWLHSTPLSGGLHVTSRPLTSLVLFGLGVPGVSLACTSLSFKVCSVLGVCCLLGVCSFTHNGPLLALRACSLPLACCVLGPSCCSWRCAGPLSAALTAACLGVCGFLFMLC